MRITLALLIFGTMALTGAIRSAPVVAPVLAFQTGQPSPQEEPRMGATEIDLVKWAVTQGGLTLLLIVVLVSYRRDFFRKNESKQAEIDDLREEKREQSAIIDRCANAMLSQAVATQANTEATRLLAQNVNNLADRRHGPR